MNFIIFYVKNTIHKWIFLIKLLKGFMDLSKEKKIEYVELRALNLQTPLESPLHPIFVYNEIFIPKNLEYLFNALS